MPDYLLLMHNDATAPVAGDWDSYLAGLRAGGNFQGGSAIGGGACARKSGAPPEITSHLSGFIRITARDLADAQTLLVGNPVFESGGTVELRALPITD